MTTSEETTGIFARVLSKLAKASGDVDEVDVASLSRTAERFSETAASEGGAVVADVITAIELTDEQREKLIEKLSAEIGRPVTLRERLDESILGGIKINIDGRVLDGSLSSQLDAMRITLGEVSQGGDA